MIVPFGDEALLVVLGESIDEALNRRVHALAAAVDRDAAEARTPWGTPVCGHASLLVPFDPLRLGPKAAGELLEGLIAQIETQPEPEDRASPPVEIAVRYGGEGGPDLEEIAERTGLTGYQVVEAHASVTYRVHLLGFVPGFAYLGELPEELRLPRRDEPRTRVPAGSVAIAGRQTCVYPAETPGGWHLIGRTDVRLWLARRDPPALLAPGDRVRFVPAAG